MHTHTRVVRGDFWKCLAGLVPSIVDDDGSGFVCFLVLI